MTESPSALSVALAQLRQDDLASAAVKIERSRSFVYFVCSKSDDMLKSDEDARGNELYI